MQFSATMGKQCPHLYMFIFLLVIMMLHNLTHGWRKDQAAQLRAFRRGKMRTAAAEEDKWEVAAAGGGFYDDGGKMEDDLIIDLPGMPSAGVTFKQYAGYVTVDELKGRSLFYYFVEAIHDPSSKPLILWLNGGPGCSSFGVGAMGDWSIIIWGGWTKLSSRPANPVSKAPWLGGGKRVANVLFVESPAGVGFSYSNTTSDYNLSGDKRTAEDTYTFLMRWFKRYPLYKNRDFYIMGESYSGFYIPELADTIIKRNMVSSSSIIQLKGIMIGNGIMNDATDHKGVYDYVWSHALISDETHQGLVDHCSQNYSSPTCEDYEERIESEVGPIDFYSIYSPVCSADYSSEYSSSSSASRRRERHAADQHIAAGFDPCDGEYVHAYVNLPQVQKLLHANTTNLPYTWEFCSRMIGSDNWMDSPSTMFPAYKRLIAHGLRIWLYSGDVDAVVPVSSTRYSIHALNLTVTKPWQPWLDDLNQVGGYRVVYEGLTFSTVRGAGHEVPRLQPRRALSLLKHFLSFN
ncbi:serine carboxypeptidase 2-like [Malania oleifera]|uniref:serine carboxypeptidase 2-like n=1 Tax=Malania oleifera TaxID=397392 RepID=UPI0025AE7081|nr:serine carboxypeptidase 2-like [Malania oleifera]